MPIHDFDVRLSITFRRTVYVRDTERVADGSVPIATTPSTSCEQDSPPLGLPTQESPYICPRDAEVIASLRGQGGVAKEVPLFGFQGYGKKKPPLNPSALPLGWLIGFELVIKGRMCVDNTLQARHLLCGTCNICCHAAKRPDPILQLKRLKVWPVPLYSLYADVVAAWRTFGTLGVQHKVMSLMSYSEIVHNDSWKLISSTHPVTKSKESERRQARQESDQISLVTRGPSEQSYEKRRKKRRADESWLAGQLETILDSDERVRCALLSVIGGRGNHKKCCRTLSECHCRNLAHPGAIFPEIVFGVSVSLLIGTRAARPSIASSACCANETASLASEGTPVSSSFLICVCGNCSLR
ncbi:hypothetical protein KCU76_g7, partial [Aureobasidium melanogenum]